MLRAAYRTLADDVRTGQFVASAADWLLDNFHLVTSEIADIRRNLPRTYSRTLPTLASREHAGHARIYAMAVELIRHSDSRLDRQQLDPVPEQLPARRAADDRRAVGVAEHAEAGAHREPAPAGRGTAVGARRPPRRRRATCRGPTTTAAVGALPAGTDPAFIVQLLHRVREYGLRLSADSRRRRRRPGVAADDGRGDDPRRAPAAGRGPGLGGQRHHEPAPVRDARLAGVRRVGQPGRAGAAARSGRRLRAHGLPEPRPAAAGRRGAGRAERRGPGARGAEGDRERPPGGRQRLDGRSRGPRRLSPRRPRAARSRSRPRAIAPPRPTRARRVAAAPRVGPLPRRDRRS